MRVLCVGGLFLLLVIAGCQTNNQTNNQTSNQIDNPKNDSEEVVNKHGDIENLKRLNKFVKNVKNDSHDKIDFVEYGIEGQRGVKTLGFDGEQIKVSFSVDGEFIEDYSCKQINVENEDGKKKYVLADCTGNFNGDSELLSVPTNG